MFHGFPTIRRLRLAILLPAGVYLAAVAGFIGGRHALVDFPLDDGWIHRVYSRSFAMGHGFQYNDGQQEAGSTSPLWAVVTAPAHWLEPLGVPCVVVAVKLIGLLLGLAAVWAAGCVARQVSGSAVVGCIAASLWALEPRLLFSSLSGMETNLLLALWIGGTAALLARRSLLAVVLFSLTPVSRPEAVVLLPLAFLAALQATYCGRRRWAIAAAWIIPVVPVLLWVTFCAATTGHCLPNTFYVKARPFQLGLAELTVAWRSLCDHGLAPPWMVLLGTAAYLLLCGVRTNRTKGLSLLALVAAPVAYLLGVVGTRPILFSGYYWTRWVDPAALMLMIPFGIGCGIVLSGLAGLPKLISAGFHRPSRFAVAGVVAGAVGVGCLAVSIPFYAKSFADRRFHLASDSRAIYIMNVQAGQWIHDHTPADAVVGLNDAGAIRYFGRRRSIDFLGLNNAALAFGRTSPRAALAEVDWLAIFPAWFNGGDLWPDIQAGFQPRMQIRMPVQEYTVCDAPGQTLQVVYEKTHSQFRPSGRSGSLKIDRGVIPGFVPPP